MARQEVYEELLALFDYSPPKVPLSDDLIATFLYPNMFYDRHQDPQLTLKHVRLIPSLPLEISRIVYDEVKLLKNKGQLLPVIENDCEDGCSFSTESDVLVHCRIPRRT